MKIKNLLRALAIITAVAITTPASAQFYEIANQLPKLISPAISGSSSYKGFLEAGYSRTLGNYDADFLEVSTSQGFRYRSWYYMGVGLGVDVMFAKKDSQWGNGWSQDSNFDKSHSSTTTGVMMPLFTDFRFNLGSPSAVNFFIDLKVGCSFLLSNKYIEIGNGYLTNQQYFYLRPTVGVKIPVNKDHPKQAINLGIAYKLLTSNYWNSWSRSITLNSLGGSVSFEW